MAYRRNYIMIESVARYLRTAQTYFPFARDLKAIVQKKIHDVTRTPFEADFNALRLFDFKSQTYLDIGANRGQSIAALRLVADDPRIVSFEPNVGLAAKLKSRCRGLPWERVESVGLGDREGAFDLYVPAYRGYLFDGLASLDRHEAMSWLNDKTIVGFDARKLTCEIVASRIRTLDSYDLAPVFIKIDVQGHELSVLKGGRSILAKHEPILMIEAPDEQIELYLQPFGYSAYRFDSRQKRFAAGFGDLNTFFMTREKAAMVDV